MSQRKDRNMTITLSFGKGSTVLARIRSLIGFIKYHPEFRCMAITGSKTKAKIILRKKSKKIC